jgi:hypothetical protein
MFASESKQPFRVEASGLTKRRFVELQSRATLEGRGDDLLNAFRQILQRLHTDPLDFGEPLYPLPNLRLQMRTCAIRPLVIDFAVSEEHRIVYVKSFQLLSAND